MFFLFFNNIFIANSHQFTKLRSIHRFLQRNFLLNPFNDCLSLFYIEATKCMNIENCMCGVMATINFDCESASKVGPAIFLGKPL